MGGEKEKERESAHSVSYLPPAAAPVASRVAASISDTFSVMGFMMLGFSVTITSYSAKSIRPSLFKSAASNVPSTIARICVCAEGEQ